MASCMAMGDQSAAVGARFACPGVWACILAVVFLPACAAHAQVPARAQDNADGQSAGQAEPDSGEPSQVEKKLPPKLPPPKDARPLSRNGQFAAWVDGKRGVVLVDGAVTLRAGPLEMFACTRNTKEHESVVAVDTRAFPIHAALLALGAEPGEPVRFQPEFTPPSGTEIEIQVQWLDTEGKLKKTKAQNWVRDARTGKAMQHPWVFAGSFFATNPETGRQKYLAEGGDFVCVSNFSTAMLDIPVESTQANEGLFFEAFTERIPPLGTPVRLVFKPVLEENDKVRSADAQNKGE